MAISAGEAGVAALQEPQASALTDDEVVRRVVGGEKELFEVLIRRYNPRVYRAARAILGSDTEAEDVMQDAWVRAYANLAQFEHRSQFTTWLLRIAVHEALARRRRQSRFRTSDIPGTLENHLMETSDRGRGPQGDPERQAYDRQMSAVLEEALDTLPAMYRTVFVLREVEELNTQETAESLGLSEEAVKVRLHRARHMLRKHLYARLGVATPQAFQFHLSRCDRVVDTVMKRIASL